MKARARRLPGKLLRRFSPAIIGRSLPDIEATAASRAPWRRALPSPSLGWMGELEVRLAASAGEVRRAQALRYRVFYEEMAAVADRATRDSRRDSDAFDAICDHLLVLDHAKLHRPVLRLRPEIVGAYRLLRQDVAARHGGFYTAGEYRIAPLLSANPHLKFLELGRSCVAKPYRDKRTVELLWQGIWAYVLQHRVDVMIGCASFPGADPDRHATALSYLHHTARAPEEWRVQAHDHLSVPLDRMPAAAIDAKAALRALPPLIKGYLRVGAYVGDGAVIDRQFGTTDVCMIMPVSAIRSRYISHFGADARRFAS